jgi:hypothetical protein
MAARKKPTRPGAKAPGRVRKNYVLEEDLARQTAACAAWLGIDESTQVAKALQSYIKQVGFYCVTRPASQPANEPEEGRTLPIHAAQPLAG